MIQPKDPGNQDQQTTATTPQAPTAVNATIRATVANGGLEAYLHMEPPSDGGATPTIDAMLSALSARGITYQINLEKLRRLANSPVYFEDVLIASGLAPVNGADGIATFQIGTDKKSLKPRENEDGTVDYRDLGIVENVKQGQILCIITPPGEGTPGISVQGNELPAKKGRPVPTLLGKNTELSEDGTAILSKIAGQVDFDGHRIHVNETFQVKENVDNSTGNLKVVGNLFVPGMVLPGFKLEAGGTITVSTRAEGSSLRAGRGIAIHGGIIGCDVYCEGDLKCRFIENSNVFIKGDINAEYIINSNVKCGKSIKISGTVSKIIGGICVAGQNIEAKTIGSPAYVQTKLELGSGQSSMEQQQKLLAQVRDLEKQNKSLAPLISLLVQLKTGNRLTPDKKQALENASYTYDTNVRLLEEARKELEEIAESVKTRGFGRIICSGIIHPGTKVTIAEASLEVKDPLSNSTLYYSQGVIQIGVAGRRS